MTNIVEVYHAGRMDAYAHVLAQMASGFLRVTPDWLLAQFNQELIQKQAAELAARR